MKAADEQPDEEIYREVWEGPEHRSFYPHRGWGHHAPNVDVFTHLEASQTPYCQDFMEASSHTRNPL